MNTIGHIYRLTTFGESHGKATGGVIDGCPSNQEISLEKIQQDLDLRKPGQSLVTTARKESDHVQILSGIFEGKTLGTPIGFMIPNEDQTSTDYDTLKDVFRPSHADFTYQQKYGIRDHRGGGRSSARETASWVVAGSIAKQILATKGIQFFTYTKQIGSLIYKTDHQRFDQNKIHTSPVRCPDENMSKKMITYLEELKQEGDSIGGIVSCVIQGVPVGIGSPIFNKLQADLAKAMLSINAAKGFQYGLGFDGLTLKGSEYNDEFVVKEGKISTKTNHSGGIQGGISNGNDIYFDVVFKPASSIAKSQNTVNKEGKLVELSVQGRHDPCVVPRAVPVVEAMAAMVILDHWLLNALYTNP